MCCMKKICSRFDYAGRLRHGSTEEISDLELDMKTLQVFQVMQWVRVLSGVQHVLLSSSCTDQNA